MKIERGANFPPSLKKKEGEAQSQRLQFVSGGGRSTDEKKKTLSLSLSRPLLLLSLSRLPSFFLLFWVWESTREWLPEEIERAVSFKRRYSFALSVGKKEGEEEKRQRRLCFAPSLSPLSRSSSLSASPSSPNNQTAREQGSFPSHSNGGKEQRGNAVGGRARATPPFSKRKKRFLA